MACFCIKFPPKCPCEYHRSPLSQPCDAFHKHIESLIRVFIVQSMKHWELDQALSVSDQSRSDQRLSWGSFGQNSELRSHFPHQVQQRLRIMWYQLGRTFERCHLSSVVSAEFPYMQMLVSMKPGLTSWLMERQQLEPALPDHHGQLSPSRPLSGVPPYLQRFWL